MNSTGRWSNLYYYARGQQAWCDSVAIRDMQAGLVLPAAILLK